MTTGVQRRGKHDEHTTKEGEQWNIWEETTRALARNYVTGTRDPWLCVIGEAEGFGFPAVEKGKKSGIMYCTIETKMTMDVTPRQRKFGTAGEGGIERVIGT